MQIKYLLLCVLLQCGYGLTSAQEIKQEQPGKKGCSCSFSSIGQVGLLSGSAGLAPLLQSVNGIRYKTWFAGVGVGIDGYKKGSFPFFLDVRKYFFETPATPFIYGDAGIHMPAKRIVSEDQWYENEYANGFYSDAGIGYKFGSSRKSGVVVSAGYSYKRMERVYRSKLNPCDYCYANQFTYTSYLHRLSIKLGWQL